MVSLKNAIFSAHLAAAVAVEINRFTVRLYPKLPEVHNEHARNRMVYIDV